MTDAVVNTSGVETGGDTLRAVTRHFWRERLSLRSQTRLTPPEANQNGLPAAWRSPCSFPRTLRLRRPHCRRSRWPQARSGGRTMLRSKP